MTLAFLVGLSPTVGLSATATTPSHDQEINAFATTMAIVRTYGENCRGGQVNEVYLESLRQRLHVVDGDYPVFAQQAHKIAEALKRAVIEAGGSEEWCASAERLYGPQGTMIPNLFRREKASP